jgi:hypothetical protein
MRVVIETARVPGGPATAGPLEPAWTYLLDEIFSDAWHANLDELRVVLPSEKLAPAVRLRAGLTPTRKGATGSGIALLAPHIQSDPQAVRTYICEYGPFAPRVLRSGSMPPPGAVRVRQLSVLTWRARAWGLLMRIGAARGMPALTDRATAAARSRFAGGRGPSFCRLSVWTR